MYMVSATMYNISPAGLKKLAYDIAVLSNSMLL